ncbi:MAG: hypothetical protein QXE12_01970 [Conexivisphaerales archaeon]
MASLKIPTIKRILLFVKLFLRSKRFTSALVAISLLSSIFVTTAAVGGQIYLRLGEDLPVLLGTNSHFEVVDYSLYVTNSGNQCLAIVNSSSFARLAGSQRGAVAGAQSGVSNTTLVALPSMLNYCMLASADNISTNGLSYLGRSEAVLGSGASLLFVRSATSSFLDMLQLFSLFGILASAALSAAAWSFVLSRSKDQLKKIREQVLATEYMRLPLCVLVAIVFSLVFLLSLMFSVFIQNVSIGVINFLLGSTLLYSGLQTASIVQSAIMAFMSSVMFIIFSFIHTRSKDEYEKLGTNPDRRYLTYLSYLIILVFFIGLASSLPFLATVASTSSLDYVSSGGGNVLIPSSTPFPLTSSMQIPERINCSSYSAEVAYPATIDGYRTVVRGVDEINSSQFYDWMIIAGRWPAAPFQIGLGSQIASRLRVTVGDVVEVQDELTGNSVRFEVTGIFQAAGLIDQEGVTGIASAQAMAGMASGTYSYLRIPYSCAKSYAAESHSVGISQLLSRIFFLQPAKLQGNLLSVFSGLQPLVNSMAALAVTIVASSSVSIWYASEVFVSASGIRKRARIRWEQGDRRSRLLFEYAAFPAFLGLVAVLVSELLSAGLVVYGPFPSVFYQMLPLPAPRYFTVLLAVLAVSLALALYNSNRRFEE